MSALKFVLGQLNLNLECGHGRVYKVPVVGYEGGEGYVEEMRVQVVNREINQDLKDYHFEPYDSYKQKGMFKCR